MEDNQERLPFADIIIQGSNEGTSNNVDGDFALIDVPDTALTLVVIYIINEEYGALYDNRE